MDCILALWTIILTVAPIASADHTNTIENYATTSARPISKQLKGTTRSTSVLNRTSSPDGRSNATTDFVLDWKDNPPKEFYPEPRPETPILVSSGARSLQFLIRIKCSESDCPNTFLWYYKQNGTTTNWTEIQETKTEYDDQIGEKISKATVKKLKNETNYLLKVQPITVSNGKHEDWFRVSNNKPYSFPSFGLTCRDQQDAVSNLTVHSAGRKWLGLSWLHPLVACTTQLQYWVRLSAMLLPPREWRYVGSVWTNKLWAVEGDVKPCSLWPNRHCLLLTQGVDDGKEYVIEVKVVRVFDNTTSQEQKTTEVAHIFPPSQPVALRCVDARPSALVLHWRCPLRPGGRLTQARVVVEHVETCKVVHNDTFDVRLRQEYQREVNGLQLSSLYKVRVSFKNRGDIEGEPAYLKVWTTPRDAGEVNPCGGMPKETIAVNSAAAVGSNAEPQVAGEGWPWWGWLLVVTLLCLSVFAFYAGRYWSNKIPWRSAKFSKSSSATSSEAGNGSSKREADISGEDLEVLCEGAGAPSKVTPPSTLMGGYSEPIFAGYARPGGPPSQRNDADAASPAPLHTYEDPKFIYKEQPYAEAVDAKAPPPPPYYEYSEVRQPSPTTTPLYAQVDKKRRPPPPPRAPPPLPLSARPANLQDSD